MTKQITKVKVNPLNPVDSFSPVRPCENLGLKPILIIMRMISVDLTSSSDDCDIAKKVNPCTRTQWLSIIYRYAAWLLTISSHSYILYFIFKQTTRLTNWMHVSTWNGFIDLANMTVHCVGVHTLVCFTFIKKWNQIQRHLIKLESQIEVTLDSNVKLQKFSILAITYVIISDGIMLALRTLMLASSLGDSALFRLLTEAALTFTKAYASLTVVLFGVIMRFVGNLINAIRCEMTEFMPLGTTITEDLLIIRLKRLRRNFTSINFLVDLLNYSFGWILLFEIQYIFVGVINASMHLFISVNGGNWNSKFLSFGHFVGHVVNLVFICLSSERLREETRVLRNRLLCLSDKNEFALKLEIESFANQLHHMVPEISAAGYFKIGKNLILTLIGTTLTYLLIMVEYYIGEKSGNAST